MNDYVWAQRLAPALTTVDNETHLRIEKALAAAREEGRQEERKRWTSIVEGHSAHHAPGAACVRHILKESAPKPDTHSGGDQEKIIGSVRWHPLF